MTEFIPFKQFQSFKSCFIGLNVRNFRIHANLPWPLFFKFFQRGVVHRSNALMNSRAVIDACRPYEWMKDFPEVAKTSAELRKAVLARFGRSFFWLR